LTIELYCGKKSHGTTIFQKIKSELQLEDKNGQKHSVDAGYISVDVEGQPSLKVNMRGFTHEEVALLKSKFPKYKLVLLASPPCENYSCCNTTGVVTAETLALSDELVALVHLFEEGWGEDHVFTVVENPALGKLPGRPISSGWPHRYVVDYCKYHYPIRKRTMLFCSQPLHHYGLNVKDEWFPPDRNATDEGPSLTHCRGNLCTSTNPCEMMYDGKHYNWEKFTLAYGFNRAAIPEGLSWHLANSIMEYLKKTLSHEDPVTSRGRVSKPPKCLFGLRAIW